ncbi:MAG: MltA domain-containing protein [Alphaproteobacteria bacterium]|jgi:membrane-bound lytic murein transglycosylase A|nr:MltA domain-containing protein [Alphaproteobacteria bacterium]MDP6815062.1 MltA domain-containing protein [Alphaproteobacteria bacterium]
MRGRTAILLVGPGLILAGLLLWWWSRPPPPPVVSYRAVDFSELTGWERDDLARALPPLLRSCRRLARWPAGRPLGGDGVAGTAGDWQAVCQAAGQLPNGDAGAARGFFEGRFRPVAVRFAGRAEGLFTGYYEPSLRGSRTRGGAYQVPLHGLPQDLIRVNLGEFSDGLKGRRIVGRLDGGRLRPYPARAGIVDGGLGGKAPVVVYVDDPVDAFFLQIQGSGRVTLAEGGEIRLGYAGRNGRPYFAIGRELIKRRVLTAETVSMQSIRRWLADNPEQAATVMNLNRSYVFFRELTGEGPLGALGVALTPGRSLAVDRRLIPMAVPIWLQATRPAATAGRPDRPLRRLLLAQDTGGAIRGGVRGDVFWGHGAEAAAIAGRMKHPGRWFLLLPKPLVDRL